MRDEGGTDDTRALVDRLADGWVYGGILMVPVMLALAPFLFAGAADRVALLLVYAALPVYMVHQMEEHDRDRFRRFVNDLLRPRRAGLTRVDVLVINIGLVWYLLTVAIVLAAAVDVGWGLIAAYALAVNGVAHVGQGIGLRRYNPGLVTAVVLFLPVAAALFLTVEGTVVQHAVCAALVVAGHAAILARALRPAPRRAGAAADSLTQPLPAARASAMSRAKRRAVHAELPRPAHADRDRHRPHPDRAPVQADLLKAAPRRGGARRAPDRRIGACPHPFCCAA